MESKLIMIVDDDPDDISLFIEAIEEIAPGIRCISAKHGMDALRQLNEQDIIPDFIFLDLNMPRMNGIDCLRELKKSMRLRHIPVIIYSTSREEKDMEETRMLGAAYFMNKPTKFDDLSEAISVILFGKELVETNLPGQVLVAF